MKVGALVCSYGLTRFLKPVLKQYDWVDKLLVLNFRYEKTPPIDEDTEDVVDELNQTNVQLISGEGLHQHEVLNFGLRQLPDFDAVFVADSDELIQRDHQQEILRGFAKEGIGCCPLIDYALDFNHRYPVRGHKPPVIVRPDIRFYNIRCYPGGAVFFDYPIHHFGFLHPEMRWKIEWEENQDPGATKKIMSQPVEPFEMPQEIKDCLKDS